MTGGGPPSNARLRSRAEQRLKPATELQPVYRRCGERIGVDRRCAPKRAPPSLITGLDHHRYQKVVKACTGHGSNIRPTAQALQALGSAHNIAVCTTRPSPSGAVPGASRRFGLLRP
jgi:hypothetical protein